MRISKRIEFDAGHRVPHHTSKCSNPHGHRYVVEVEVEGIIQPADGRSEGGMVIDFSVLKDILTLYVHDVYDHGFIVWAGDDAMLDALDNSLGWKVVVIDSVPTAENLVGIIADDIAPHLHREHMRLSRVTVLETPTSRAECTW